MLVKTYLKVPSLRVLFFRVPRLMLFCWNYKWDWIVKWGRDYGESGKAIINFESYVSLDTSEGWCRGSPWELLCVGAICGSDSPRLHVYTFGSLTVAVFQLALKTAGMWIWCTIAPVTIIVYNCFLFLGSLSILTALNDRQAHHFHGTFDSALLSSSLQQCDVSLSMA